MGLVPAGEARGHGDKKEEKQEGPTIKSKKEKETKAVSNHQTKSGRLRRRPVSKYKAKERQAAHVARKNKTKRESV